MLREHQRLVYLSRNAIVGTLGDIDRGISDILTVARRKNHAREVTGALIFNNGCFAQVLEGEKRHVQEIFGHIEADPRHRNLVLLQVEPCQQRLFPDWSMAYVGPSPEEPSGDGTIDCQAEFDPATLNASKICQMLQNIMTMPDLQTTGLKILK